MEKVTNGVSDGNIILAVLTKQVEMLKQRSAEEKANSHRARESCLAQELKLGDILKLKNRVKTQSWFY